MHLEDWTPAGEHGPGFYVCSCGCGTTGRRMLSGPVRGKIKPRPSEARSLSMTDTSGGYQPQRANQTSDAEDGRAQLLVRATRTFSGGWAHRLLPSKE